MGLINWMGLGKKKNQEVNVVKLKGHNAAVGEMAAGNPTAAASALSDMLAQKHTSTKILMVQDGDHLPQVTDYAIRMAQRLDCEIIALDVNDTPLQFSGERQERESHRFHEKARKNAEKFALKAKAQGVQMKHIMEITDQEEAIARLSAKDTGIRYVLTKPDQESLRGNKERAQVPVFDLNCSRLTR